MKCDKRIVGYYSSWQNRYLVEDQISNFTHLIFAFAEMNSDGQLSIDHKKDMFLILKEKARRADVKVMISTDYYFRVFIEAVVQFINRYRIDGVDFNFEWSKNQKDKADDVILLKEIRTRLDKEAKLSGRSPYTVSMMVPSTNLDPDDEIYLNALLGYLDFMSFHTMNYYKYWKYAPNPYGKPPPSVYSESPKPRVNQKLNYLACTTRTPSKLNIPVNFYKFIETNASKQTFLPWGHRPDSEKELKEYDDEERHTFDYDLFENEKHVQGSMFFTFRRDFGGVAIWSIEFDDNEMTLTNAVVTGTKKFCSKTRDKIYYDC
uniref:Glyco_18 domain-containing protein n=2 Tax=Caenorhabditis tropicalis TaxID=1561998 RepID=A0A1I7UWM5_9PELO